MSLSSRETKMSESERYGSLGGWLVGERYEIRDGVIRDTREGDHFYFPVYHQELPAHLARIKDESTALEFASKWGQLGSYIFHEEEHETLEWYCASDRLSADLRAY